MIFNALQDLVNRALHYKVSALQKEGARQLLLCMLGYVSSNDLGSMVSAS